MDNSRKISSTIQRTFRIRPKAFEVYKFLEFDYIKKHKTRDNCFDRIISFSLDYMKNNKLHFMITEYIPQRDVIGSTLQLKTYNDLMHFCNNNSHLFIAEIIEICIYIYAINNLSESELEFINIDYIESGFTKIYTE